MFRALGFWDFGGLGVWGVGLIDLISADVCSLLCSLGLMVSDSVAIWFQACNAQPYPKPYKP